MRAGRTSDDLDQRLESKINGMLQSKLPGRRPEDGFKGNKVVNEVLDRSTVMTLFGMIRSGVISGVNGAVKAGKESVVFWAVADGDGDGGGRDIALKIYLVSTSNFKNRMPYIRGDPRFSRVRGGTRNLVYLWAKKEFRNLARCAEAGIPVPAPVTVAKNVLAMEFVGSGGAPAGTLLESAVDAGDYAGTVDILRRLYRDAGLVHGDLSEYNVFKTGPGLVLFDLGSAVDVSHPRSGEFLRRDIHNVTRFFVRRGLTVENPADVYGSVVS